MATDRCVSIFNIQLPVMDAKHYDGTAYQKYLNMPHLKIVKESSLPDSETIYRFRKAYSLLAQHINETAVTPTQRRKIEEIGKMISGMEHSIKK